MHPVLQVLSGRQHGVFSSCQALAAGYTSEEIQALLRSGRWCRVRRGIYADVATLHAIAGQEREQHLLDCAAVQLALQRPIVLSHWSAARFHRLRFLGAPPAAVHGTDPDQARDGRGYRISGAMLPPPHIEQLAGWRLTTGARSVVDLSRGLPFLDGVVLADSALGLGRATAEQLQAVVHACSHWEGIGQAARTCAFADGLAESVLESMSRVVLVSFGVPTPRLQCKIRDAAGLIGRVDMYWEDLGIVGEADGKIKYDEPYADRVPTNVLWAEKLREDRLRATGLGVVRWTHREITHFPDTVVKRFWSAVRRQSSAATPVLS